jgi:hypothetical protein
MKITVFRDLTPCRLVESYQLFKRMCCLSLQGTRVTSRATMRHVSGDSSSYDILAHRSNWGSSNKFMDFSGSNRDEEFVLQLSDYQFLVKGMALRRQRYTLWDKIEDQFKTPFVVRFYLVPSTQYHCLLLWSIILYVILVLLQLNVHIDTTLAPERDFCYCLLQVQSSLLKELSNSVNFLSHLGSSLHSVTQRYLRAHWPGLVCQSFRPFISKSLHGSPWHSVAGSAAKLQISFILTHIGEILL